MLKSKVYLTPNAVDVGDEPPARPSRRRSNTIEKPAAVATGTCTDNHDNCNGTTPTSIDEVRSNAARLLMESEQRQSQRQQQQQQQQQQSNRSFRMTAMTRHTHTQSIVIQVDGTSGCGGTSDNRSTHGHLDADECSLGNDTTTASSDDEESAAGLAYGSLPSVEEARLYAGRILNAKSARDLSPESAERSRLTAWRSSVTPFRKERHHNNDHRGGEDRYTDEYNNNNNDNERVHLSKGIPLTTPPHILAKQKRFARRCLIVGLAIAVLTVIIATSVHVLQTSQQQSSAQQQQQQQQQQEQDASQQKENPQDPSTASPRLAETISFLTRHTISHRNHLDDLTSPQYQAAVWIADHDALVYEVPYTHLDDTYLDFVQRYTLAVLYFSMNGHDWVNQCLFLDKVHACAWYTTDTLNDGKEVALGVSCNDRGEVYELLMPRNNMVGTLPMELSHLSSLHFVDLNRNSIHGRIPEEFSNLERMEFFDLRYNEVTGTIPTWIGGAWTELTEFALSNNNMTGSLPESLRYLQKLKSLSLAQNFLTSNLVNLVRLSSLQYLYLENNRFTGTVDGDFLTDMMKLVQVDVSSNQLTASDIPIHLFQHPALQVLDLGDNSLMGRIPSDMVENTVLHFLSLSDNILAGSLPASISKLKALRHLDITGNDISGQIPTSLATMESLTYLFLSENAFSEGPLPDFLSEMPQLKELSLSSTQRNGTLPPEWLTRLSDLVLLDVSRNELTGSIPSTVWEHPNLQYLLLNRNEFTGAFPAGVTETMLELLLLDKNNITGDMGEACDYAVNFISVDCEEIACDCCKCCSDSDELCNVGIWDFNQEFSWEQNYTRVTYAFSPALLDDSDQSGRREVV